MIGDAVASRAVAALGGHPFYLQMLGEALTRGPHAPTLDDLKAALQELPFSRTGRLWLYFEREYARLVARTTTLAATLAALADGPIRLSDIASRIKASTGATVRYIERLGDAVRHRDDGLYELADGTFALWLRWRRPGGTVVSMSVVGDEAEQAVAEALAAMGFELVYQSRASRGAFDLLALRDSEGIGLQVKRSGLPLRFPRAAWDRMEADARRFGWAWVIASVDPDGDVRVLDPARCKRGREVRLGADAVIDNLLLWLDRRRLST